MSQHRSDLHTFTNFFIYIFPPNLYLNRLDVWKCENSCWPPYYFVILIISESFDTVAFVRILWCSCRVYTFISKSMSFIQCGVNFTDTNRNKGWQLRKEKLKAAPISLSYINSVQAMGNFYFFFHEKSFDLTDNGLMSVSFRRKNCSTFHNAVWLCLLPTMTFEVSLNFRF